MLQIVDALLQIIQWHLCRIRVIHLSMVGLDSCIPLTLIQKYWNFHRISAICTVLSIGLVLCIRRIRKRPVKKLGTIGLSSLMMINGKNLNVLNIHANDSQPTILFIHGLGGGVWIWYIYNANILWRCSNSVTKLSISNGSQTLLPLIKSAMVYQTSQESKYNNIMLTY